MNIKEIIQRLQTAMNDARGQESHFESWLTQNEGICDAIDALKELDKPEQEPVAWRPAFDYDGYDLEGTWNNGKPTEKDLEFWGNTKVGIEYAYKIKGNI